MLTDHQLNRLWDELIAAQTRSYYFGELVHKYQRRQNQITFLSLVFSSGAAVVFLLQLGNAWAAPAAAFVSAALSIYSLVAQNQKRSIESADLHTRWAEITTECVHLWESWFDENAIERLGQIEKHAAEASKSSTQFPANKRAMARWMELAEAHHRESTAA